MSPDITPTTGPDAFEVRTARAPETVALHEMWLAAPDRYDWAPAESDDAPLLAELDVLVADRRVWGAFDANRHPGRAGRGRRDRFPALSFRSRCCRGRSPARHRPGTAGTRRGIRHRRAISGSRHRQPRATAPGRRSCAIALRRLAGGTGVGRPCRPTRRRPQCAGQGGARPPALRRSAPSTPLPDCGRLL